MPDLPLWPDDKPRPNGWQLIGFDFEGGEVFEVTMPARPEVDEAHMLRVADLLVEGDMVHGVTRWLVLPPDEPRVDE